MVFAIVAGTLTFFRASVILVYGSFLGFNKAGASVFLVFQSFVVGFLEAGPLVFSAFVKPECFLRISCVSFIL